VVAVPIRIANQVCGVLELLNRQETGCYSAQDRNLLEIFADYISISVQNALDSRQAQELAKRDNLTELYNDRHLHTALTAAIDHARREGTDLALLFVDLDFFKHVNDSHGHLAGSQVLREVGRLLAEIVPEELGTAARYGGDEFVLTLPGAELEAAVDLAEEIRSRIETTVFCAQPGTIQPTPLFLRGITCSIGIATLSRHLSPELPLEEAKSTLLHLSDAAMYVSKETGRNRTAVAGEVVRRRTPAVSTTRAR
jgi:diguanylate cyclase (GGDEF)-like protein